MRMKATFTGKWLFFGITQDPGKSQYLTLGNQCVCMSKNNRVPVLRGSGGASWRRQNTSSSPTQLGFPESAALPNAASVCAPARSALLPGSAPTGRTQSHPRTKPAGGGWGGGIYTSNSAGLVGFFFFFPDSCWSGRGQIRRRWHREIPGIPVFVVRNVALTVRTAAETRNALAGRWSWWSLGWILVLILIFSGLCTQYAVFAPVSLHVKNDSSHRLVCLLLGIDRKFVEKLMLTLIKLMSSFSVSAF